MARVAVIGCGGAGKSTFARELGWRLELEVTHLDRLYWQPGWVPTPAEEWRGIQQNLVARPAWIIDGNYGSTFDIRLRAADVVVFFDVPGRVALAGVIRRWAGCRGRDVAAVGCPERLDWAFLRWVWRYPRDSRPRALSALAEHAGSAEVIVVRTRSEARRAVSEVAALTA